MKKNLTLLTLLLSIFIICSLNFKVKASENFMPINESATEYACATEDCYMYDKLGNIIDKIYTGDMLIIKKYLDTKSIVIEKKTGIIGFIENKNFNSIDDSNIGQIKNLNNKGIITNVDTAVNIREFPSINSLAIDSLTNKTELNIIGKTGKWYKVKINDEIGYIFEEYIHNY